MLFFTFMIGIVIVATDENLIMIMPFRYMVHGFFQDGVLFTVNGCKADRTYDQI